MDTQYISDKTLKIALTNLTDEAVIVVNQLGSSSTIFRSSNSVIFQAPENFEEIKNSAEAVVSDTKEEDLSADDILAVDPSVQEDTDNEN